MLSSPKLLEQELQGFTLYIQQMGLYDRRTEHYQHIQRPGCQRAAMVGRASFCRHGWYLHDIGALPPR